MSYYCWNIPSDCSIVHIFNDSNSLIFLIESNTTMTTNYFNQETVQEMVILIIYSAKDLKAKPVLKKT